MNSVFDRIFDHRFGRAHDAFLGHRERTSSQFPNLKWRFAGLWSRSWKKQQLVDNTMLHKLILPDLQSFSRVVPFVVLDKSYRIPVPNNLTYNLY